MVHIKFPSIFKIPAHKKFEYNPFYYDKQNEEWMENPKKSEHLNGLNGKKRSIKFNSKFGNKHKAKQGQSKNVLISQLRVVAIILFLLAVAWYLLH